MTRSGRRSRIISDTPRGFVARAFKSKLVKKSKRRQMQASAFILKIHARPCEMWLCFWPQQLFFSFFLAIGLFARLNLTFNTLLSFVFTKDCIKVLIRYPNSTKEDQVFASPQPLFLFPFDQ